MTSNILEKPRIPTFFVSNDLTTRREKKLVLFTKDLDTQIATCYDGTRLYPMQLDEMYANQWQCHRRDECYVHVAKVERIYGIDDIKELYELYTNDMDKLKRREKRLNMYRTMCDVPKASYQFFVKTARKLGIVNERQSLDEVPFLKTYSAVVFANRDYVGKKTKVHCYDFKSSYPSVMLKEKFPIKRGEVMTIKTLKDLPDDFYGIVKCKIANTSDKIRDNPDCYHTHVDIARAIQLGVDITIINEENNCLYYSPDKLVANLFKEFVTRLMWLKNRGDEKLSKMILNSLWGYFAHHKTHQFRLFHNSDVEFNMEGKHITRMDMLNEMVMIEYWTPDDYTSEFARIAPFVVAYGRKKIYDIFDIVPFEDVVRVHTDGIYLKHKHKKKLKHLIGDSCGDLKYEGKWKVLIKDSHHAEKLKQY